MTDKSK